MSSSNAPFGLVPEQHQSGYGTRGETAVIGGIVTGYATAIYKYQPVKFATTGYLEAAAAGNALAGVFMGVEWTDSNGRRQISNNWVANTAGTDIVAYINDDPNTIFEMQADGSLTVAAIGDMADISNATASSGGLSQATISTTLVGAGNSAQLQVIGLANRIDNAWGDSYTVVRVKINEHQFAASHNAI
jgi:hypothetical protein